MEFKVKVSWLRHSTGCHLDLANANGNSAISAKTDIPGICSDFLQCQWMTENYSTAYLPRVWWLLNERNTYIPPRCLIHKLYKTVRPWDDRREVHHFYRLVFWLEGAPHFCKATSPPTALHHAEAVFAPAVTKPSTSMTHTRSLLERNTWREIWYQVLTTAKRFLTITKHHRSADVQRHAPILTHTNPQPWTFPEVASPTNGLIHGKQTQSRGKQDTGHLKTHSAPTPGLTLPSYHYFNACRCISLSVKKMKVSNKATIKNKKDNCVLHNSSLLSRN